MWTERRRDDHDQAHGVTLPSRAGSSGDVTRRAPRVLARCRLGSAVRQRVRGLAVADRGRRRPALHVGRRDPARPDREERVVTIRYEFIPYSGDRGTARALDGDVCVGSILVSFTPPEVVFANVRPE